MFMNRKLNFSNHLKKQALKIKEYRSGERTRLLLLSSVAKLLDKHNLKDLKITTIRTPTKASQGTFYIYFTDKEDMAAQLFVEYIEYELELMPVLDNLSNVYDMSLAINNWYADMFQANSGILRTFLTLNEENPKVTEIWKLRGEKIVSRVVEFCNNLYQLKPEELDAISKSTQMLSTALDRIVLSMYCGSGAHPKFNHKNDREETIELLSLLFVRAIAFENPSVKTNSPAKVLSKLKLKYK